MFSVMSKNWVKVKNILAKYYFGKSILTLNVIKGKLYIYLDVLYVFTVY